MSDVGVFHDPVSQVNTSLSTSRALPCTRRSTSPSPGTTSDDVRFTDHAEVGWTARVVRRPTVVVCQRTEMCAASFGNGSC